MIKIGAEHLSRQACVYIRQSSPGQVQNNLESQRLQYALVDRAQALGWQDVQVIDEDLGVSGSGTAHRPGFERLLSGLCEGKVGAVLSVEASRLARNGRDWHTLLEFCSVVGALLIDAEGIYDPRQINDRLLLGMKGTISEMEIASFRQRARAAIEQKAQRGQLFMRVPVGYVRTVDDRIEKDPDERVRTAIDLLLRKFSELMSARKLYLWLREQQIKLPINRGVKGQRQIVWQVPSYWAVLSVLKNPAYAGAYAYGRSKCVTKLENGRKRIAQIQKRRREDWSVLITEHHEGYIDWTVYESNQSVIAHNENAKGDKVRGSIKRGVALLCGLLRCGHCGAKLHAEYPRPDVVRYTCVRHVLDTDTSCRLMFGGARADQLVAEQVIRAIQPVGLQAAIEVIENVRDARDERLRQTELAIEQARYEARRAQGQYDAVDASNRLVASELERRWNEALKVQSQLEEELRTLQREQPKPLTAAMKAELLSLADDLPRLWDHPKSSPEHKKRILRTVLKEIVAQSFGDGIRLILHWQGGDHTELQFPRTRIGHHRYVSSEETIELIRTLATIQPDSMIASILNRMSVKTAHGQSWTATRVCSIRHHHEIPRYREEDRQARGELSVSEVAALLHVTPPTVLRMIRQGHLPATQVCANAPWILLKKDIESLQAAGGCQKPPQTVNENQLSLEIQ